MREPISKTERITTDTEASADRRNADLAKHLAIGFTDKVTGKDPRAARAVAGAIEEYTEGRPYPRGGQSKLSWLIGALGAMTVALQGCEDRQEDDVLTRNVAALGDDVRTSHTTSEEVGRRIEQDVARVRRSIESEEQTRTIARNVLDVARPQGEFDLRFAEGHNGAEGQAEYIHNLVSLQADSMIDELIQSEHLYIPGSRMPSLKHALRLKIVIAINRILNGEATALDMQNTRMSEFTRAVRDNLMSLERTRAERYAAY